ncbi:dehydrogenase [Streptomyces bingchenggensis BCW-1]|uniref:Dehydrogenase n=1 Tax=Streptomyces bingchenggensis (strain BCW-1) TaxID=749414 RepID=D7BUV9_STRBB|nr:dehydrogenase [Streptomyces bingchenggensis BCW-1]
MSVHDFADRPGVALVAGGTGGIGAAVVRLLAERGSDVAFTYRSNKEAAGALVGEVTAYGRHVGSLRVDLTDEEATARAVTETAAAGGGLHTLVYAAGPHVPMRHLSRVTPAQYRAQLEADAVAFFNLVHPALPLLRKSRGSVVAVTTVATRRFPVRHGRPRRAVVGRQGSGRGGGARPCRRGGAVRRPRQLCRPRHAHGRHRGPADRLRRTRRGRPRHHPAQYPAAPVRPGGGHRGGGRVPRLGARRVHHRTGTGGRRRVQRLNPRLMG